MNESGFKRVTRVDAARERLLDVVSPVEATTTRPLAGADERVLAEPVTAARDVPHYVGAAVDGYAVRARDTFGSSRRSPAVLRERAEEVGPEAAVPVHTGSELPDGADAVVMVEETERVPGTGTERATGEQRGGEAASRRSDPGAGDEIEVFDAVGEGENVTRSGEDVTAGTELYEAGHQLRPSDLGLLKSTGITEVECYDRPSVGVVPTGEELVQSEPKPGEVVETNGLTVSTLVERWGGRATYRNVVTDDEAALRAAIQRDLTKDLVVTTGGSSVGERDLVPEVVDELGEVLVHGVALKPGHPCALGVVEDTPVLMLPGYPVACIVNAVQFLRPALKAAGRMAREPFPTTEARLSRKIASAPGERTFARVTLAEEGEETVATPTRASGAGVLSSVALADGWVVVPDDSEGIVEGATVEVQHWESHV